MGKILINESNLINIANSIREKTGKTDTFKPGEMAEAIDNISTGGGEEYFVETIEAGAYNNSNIIKMIKNIPHTTKINGTSMRSMFYGGINLQDIPIMDTSKVTNMYTTFYNCNSLKTIPLLETKNVTTMYGTFSGCSSLEAIPLLDTGNVSSMSIMFTNCINLRTIPLLNTSKVTTIQNMVENCPNLSDKSLNNILAMCANITKMAASTLKHIGLSSEQAEKCQSLSNYEAFLAAGWTTGY